MTTQHGGSLRRTCDPTHSEDFRRIEVDLAGEARFGSLER